MLFINRVFQSGVKFLCYLKYGRREILNASVFYLLVITLPFEIYFPVCLLSSMFE